MRTISLIYRNEAILPHPLTRTEGITMSEELDPVEEVIGKPLERMAPGELARYVTIYQREANNIFLTDPPTIREVSVFKSFQKEYGKDRTAALFRHVFLKNGGRMEVRKGEKEYVAHRHFSTAMRWWTERIDVMLQARTEQKAKVSERFIFTSEL